MSVLNANTILSMPALDSIFNDVKTEEANEIGIWLRDVDPIIQSQKPLDAYHPTFGRGLDLFAVRCCLRFQNGIARRRQAQHCRPPKVIHSAAVLQQDCQQTLMALNNRYQLVPSLHNGISAHTSVIACPAALRQS
jgi:hypothetical protein